MQLFEQATKVGIVEDSYTQRLNFAALAEWVRVRGVSNPGGLFWSVLNWKKNPDGSVRNAAPAWHFVTADAEEAVRAKLGAFISGEPVVERERAKPKRVQRIRDLSNDAQALRAVRAQLRVIAPFVGEGELLCQFERQGWNTERFNAAQDELEEFCSKGATDVLEPLAVGEAW